MSVKWLVRPSLPQDQPFLSDLYLTMRRTTFTWIDAGQFSVDDFGVHTRDEIVSVCENPDGDLAGFLSLWSPDDFIHMLYVCPEYQRQGVGKALLSALPEWPARSYKLKCFVQNTPARAFYRAQGFYVTGTGMSPEGAYEEWSSAPESGSGRR